MIVLLLAEFAFTQYFVNLHKQTEASLAQRWFARGDQSLQARYPDVAAYDYRTALTYDRDNQQYQLRLGQALLAAGRFNEARAHLSSLWEEEPADGEVDLTLARLYARIGNATDAVRYYRNSINGVWETDPRAQRVAARFELVDYLLKRNDKTQASAELIALQADAPSDVPDQLRLANLLLQVGEAKRSVDVYNAVLKNNRNEVRAWLGLGEASFSLSDYHNAEQAFAGAAQRDPNNAEARQQLDLVREVLRIDPLLRGLSIAERARRVALAFQTSLDRLAHCAAEKGYSFAPAGRAPSKPGQVAAAVAATAPAPDNLQQLYTQGVQKKTAATEAALRKDPDLLEPTMQYVFNVERATQPLCSRTSDTDHALLVLAQHENKTSL